MRPLLPSILLSSALTCFNRTHPLPADWLPWCKQLVEPARSFAREGQLDIHTTGTCFVVWDNAFSWINPKALT